MCVCVYVFVCFVSACMRPFVSGSRALLSGDRSVTEQALLVAKEVLSLIRRVSNYNEDVKSNLGDCLCK